MTDLKDVAEKVLTTLHDSFGEALRAASQGTAKVLTGNERSFVPVGYSSDGTNWELHIPIGHVTVILEKSLNDMQSGISLIESKTTDRTSNFSLWDLEAHVEVFWGIRGPNLSPIVRIWGCATPLGQPFTEYEYSVDMGY